MTQSLSTSSLSIPFDNSYARLPHYFYVKQNPLPVTQPALIRFNNTLWSGVGLDSEGVDSVQLTEIFAGNLVPEGAEPLAMTYSGHQFGSFAPVLGDGRAIQLGEVLTPGQQRYDIQLKGSGRTAFSRGGDGRAALGPVLREYILCEFMHAMGVPTTRALAAVLTGENVVREHLIPGAIITRLSESFVRVGTFQFFAARGKEQAIRELADYVIRRNYPEAADAENPYLALLEMVIARQAKLIAQWMHIGFIHGVMNTDNMSITSETIDYGPCAFMDSYIPDKVFSSIDRQGRYAYQNQPSIGHWNLCRFAETLIPLLGEDYEAGGELVQVVINSYPQLYKDAWLAGMQKKLGLTTTMSGDRDLADDLLIRMFEGKADYTLAFRRLSELTSEPSATIDQSFLSLFSDADAARAWLVRWRERLLTESVSDGERQSGMMEANPLYIARNHLVEASIRAAEDEGDFKPFHDLVDVLQKPFVDQGRDEYALPPRPEEEVQRTFCGT